MLATTPPLPSTQNDQAATCKSQLQMIPELQSSLANCRNTEELQRASQLLSTVDNIPELFSAQAALFQDMLSTGDSFFGTSASTSAIEDVKSRNKELKQKLADTQASIDKYTAIVERSERDFIDEKDAAPEMIQDRFVHVLDDYTLLVLAISYAFVVLAGALSYMASNSYSITSIVVSLVAAAAISLFLTILALIIL
jgi:hypothetical protein